MGQIVLKKIDLNYDIVDLDGNKMPGSNMGKLVAKVLAEKQDGDALKLFSLAMRLHTEGSFECDESDFNLIHEEVKNTKFILALGKAQILTKLKES